MKKSFPYKGRLVPYKGHDNDHLYAITEDLLKEYLAKRGSAPPPKADNQKEGGSEEEGDVQFEGGKLDKIKQAVGLADKEYNPFLYV
jgi:hypothetical protein